MQTRPASFHTASVNCPAKGRTENPVEFAPMFDLIIPPWLNIASFCPCHMPDINSCAKETSAEITKLGVLGLWLSFSQDGKNKLVIILAGLKLPWWLQDERLPFLPHCLRHQWVLCLQLLIRQRGVIPGQGGWSLPFLPTERAWRMWGNVETQTDSILVLLPHGFPSHLSVKLASSSFFTPSSPPP